MREPETVDVETIEPVMGDPVPTPSEPENDSRLTKARNLAREVRKAETDYLRSKEFASKKKKILEFTKNSLTDYLGSLDQPMPLFDRPEVSPDASDDDSWMDFPTASMGLPTGVLAKLEEADLLTVGQISEWTESGKKLTDIPGIGAGKAVKIEDALDAFWTSLQKFRVPAEEVVEIVAARLGVGSANSDGVKSTITLGESLAQAMAIVDSQGGAK